MTIPRLHGPSAGPRSATWFPIRGRRQASGAPREAASCPWNVLSVASARMEQGARVRLVDVARAAEVSLSAASVALNGRPGVSEPTRAKVQAVARKLGYVADASAASMRSGRTKIIGYVAEDDNPPHLVSLAAAAADVGHLLVVAPPGGVAFLVRRGVDG